MGLAAGFDDQILAQRRGIALDQLQRFAGFTHGEQYEAALAGGSDHAGRPVAIVGPDHCMAASVYHVRHQARLGGEIGLHGAVVIKMVAGKIGEGCGRDRQTLGAILVEPVARGFERGVADAFTRQAGHGGQKRHDIGRRQAAGAIARGNAVITGGHAQRSDAGSAVPCRLPQLAGEFGRAGLAVGAGDGNRGGREGREIAGGQRGKGPAGIGVGDMDSAVYPDFGAGHDGDGAGGNGGGDIVLTIHPNALEGAKDGAGRDLAVIKRKAGDDFITGFACIGEERAEPHRYSLASTAAGSRPVRSRSRLGSGTTPKGGAMRRMMLLMVGATTMPAVRKP